MKNKYTNKPDIIFYDAGNDDPLVTSNGVMSLSGDPILQPPQNPPSTDKGFGGIEWSKLFGNK